MVRAEWTLMGGALALALSTAACGDPGDGGETDGGAGTESDSGGEDAGSDGGDTGPAPTSCEEGLAVTAPMRRMTAAQYRNTVEDLFHGVATPSALFPESDSGFQYSNNPEANIVTLLKAENIMLAAEQVGAGVADQLDAIWQCSPELPDESACAAAFIDEYGARAFRRPLADDELAALRGLYTDARATLEHEVALGAVVATMLQMPQFLYFVEVGEAGVAPGDGERIQLSDWEVATRLSYLLWDTTPDDALRVAAAAGELSTPAQLEAHARRLLASPRARPAVSRFFREWLGVHELSPSAKDDALFPEFDGTLAAAMVHEFDRFVLGVALADEGGTLGELLTSSITEVDAAMASFYGVPQSMTPGPGEWATVELDPARRPGVLTRAAVLAEHANVATSSAIFRGHLVREELLCDRIPPPPPGAMAMVSFPAGSTQREQSELLQQDPVCGSCHVYMNPIGLGLERYDAIGAWRDAENGAPIDTSGEVKRSSSGLEASFDGAPELAQLLAADDATHACFVEQWHEHALGVDAPRDASCSADALTQSFLDSGGDLDAMIIAFVTSEAFSTRRLPEVSP